MHRDRLVSIAAGTLLDVDPADAVEAAHRAGWSAAGIWFDAATWTGATTKDVRRRLDDTGLIALDVEPVILGPDGDAGEALIDAAVELGARNVLVASRRDDRPYVVDRFGELCDRAAGAGLTVVLEFLPIFGIRTLGDALEVVRAAGRPNGGVLVDSLHLARSGGSPDDLGSVDRHLLPYLQLADAPGGSADRSIGELLHEALHGRLLVGDGGLPIRELLDVVPDVPLSFELRSKQLMIDHPDPADRAAAVLASWQRFIDVPERPTPAS